MKRFLLSSCAGATILALLPPHAAEAQQVYTVPAGTQQNIATPISDGTTPTTVQVTGGGALGLLSPSNSYSGGTQVIDNSAVLVGTDSQLGNIKGSLSLGDSTNAGELGLTNQQGIPFVSQRSIILNAGGGTINAGGGNPANLNVTGGAILNGQISGPGGLTVSTGTVTLTNNANSFGGNTTINGNGALIYSNDAQLGATSIGTPNTINLGDSTYQGTLVVTGNANAFTSIRNVNVNAGGGLLIGPTNGTVVTYAGTISGTGTLAINGGTVALTNSSNSYGGGTIVTNGGTLQVNSDGALGGSAVTTVSLGDNDNKGTLAWTNSVAVSSSRGYIIGLAGGEIDTNAVAGVSLAGSVSGLGALRVGGNGVLTLAGSNLYTGETYVNKGASLAISSDQSLGGYNATTSPTTGLPSYTQQYDNILHLDGGTLALTAGTTLTHNIALSSNGGTINTNGNTVIIQNGFGAPNAITDDTASNGGGGGGLTVENINITSTSTTSNTPAGNLILDGINTYTGGTTVASGELTIGDSANPGASVLGNVTVKGGAILAGAGTIGGTIFNNGTVAPANALNATGLTQSPGAALTPVIGATTSPMTAGGGTGGNPAELIVKGTANLGGTLGVLYAPGFLHGGQYQILTADATTGAFSNFSAGNPGLGFTANIVQEGNSFILVLTQLSSLPAFDTPSIYPVLTTAAVNEAQQATSVLLDRLTDVRTNATADQLSAALTERHRVRGGSPYGVWVQPTGNSGTMNGNNGVNGYSSQGGGLMAGIDAEWTTSVSIGFALGYNNSFIKQTGNSSGTISVPRMAVYGGWWRGPFALDGVLGIGLGTIDGNRPVNDSVTLQQAHSNHNADERTAALQASAVFAFDGWVIGPAVGAKFLNMHQTSYTETGTALYNFTVEAASVNSLRPYGNLDLTKRFMITDHWALVPDLKAGFEHELNHDLTHVVTQTQGDAYNFLYYGLLPGADILRLDGGLKLETSRDMAFYVNYDHQQSSTSNSQYISGGFRYRL